MKKIYSKPCIETTEMIVEELMAASNQSLDIFENEEMGAGQALGNQEGNIDVWGSN